MLKFNSLHLKKCVYFNDATLPLNTGEILVVNGRNLKSREKQQTNGSGKSLFFSYLPNIVFASHPLAIRANSKKEMFAAGSEGKATVDFDSGDANYRVTQKGGGSSVGYDIKKNGKSQNIRTTPLSEKYIRSVFPLTEAEFYTTVYLNSQRDFVFQRGKSDSRLKFFTEFFRLDYYDQMKAMFQEDLRKVKRVEIEVSAHEGQRLRLVEDLKELESERVGDLDELIEQQATLRKKRKRLADTVDRLTQEKSFVDLQAQLMKSIGSAERPSEKATNKLESSIEEIEQQLEVQRKIAHLEKQLEQNTENAADAKNSLRKICKDLGLTVAEIKAFDPNSSIVSSYRKIEEQLEDFSVKQERFIKVRRKLAELKENLSVSGKLLPQEKLNARIAECNQQIETYKKLKAHVEDETCPICGSVVDLDKLRKKAVVAQKTIVELAAQADYHKTSLQLVEIDFDVKAYKQLQSKQKELAEEFEKHEKVRSKYRSAINLLAEYKTADSAAKATQESLDKLAKKKTDVDTSRLPKLRDQLANSESLLKLFKQLDKLVAQSVADGVDLKGLDSAEVKASLAKATNLYSKIEGELESTSSKVNRNTVQVEKEKLLARKMKEVNAKIEELNSVLADKEILENLIKVYSNKGIKIQRVNAICRILERNMNHFKSLLFDENFKFKIHIEDSAFDVIVDRSDGIVSDVRHLSGSEGRRFNLLLLISLLPLTPSNRRSNLVILDEMESNASPTSIRLFCERFLPELHKLVPNIIVVSPLDLRIENSKQVLVTKDKAGSRIEFVNQISG